MGYDTHLRLTPREADCLPRVAAGRLNKEIAADLGISERTVKSYISTLMHKFEAHNRTELVAQAIAFGYIDPPAPALVVTRLTYQVDRLWAGLATARVWLERIQQDATRAADYARMALEDADFTFSQVTS